MRIEIQAKGHRNITSRHRTTLEITKDDELGPKGDCIVAVSADKGFIDLTEDQRNELRNSRILVTFQCNGLSWSVEGVGSKGLEMGNPTEMVIRKSRYECPRTLMIRSDKASIDMPRDMVSCLKEPSNNIKVIIETLGPPDSRRSRQSNHT